jgi:hypothetical protein
MSQTYIRQEETRPENASHSPYLFFVILHPSGGAYRAPKDQEWNDAPALTGQPIPPGSQSATPGIHIHMCAIPNTHTSSPFSVTHR